VGVRGRLPVGVRSPDPLAALVCQDCPMAPGLAGRYGAGRLSGSQASSRLRRALCSVVSGAGGVVEHGG
jgi:hypothetical protein